MLIAVASEVEPITDPFLIDRVTTTAEHNGCEVVICVNKTDASDCSRLKDIYSSTGYRVIGTSALTGEGIPELADCIAGKVCAFSGNSGVGKSSILNALEPSLGLKTGEISEKLGRGRHTTRHVEIFPLPAAIAQILPALHHSTWNRCRRYLKKSCNALFRNLSRT